MDDFENFELFMKKALEQAVIAGNIDEAPVGCVIVKNNEIIASGYNRRESDQNAVSHAEITAISAACKKTGFWRLEGCDLYVTLEPCPMCAGAIINARIRRVFFGAPDYKSGAFGSVVDLASYPFNHKPEVRGGILANESACILSGFFKELRLRSR